MKYVPLSKLYYKQPTKVINEYNKRYNAPFTRHFDFCIKEYNRNTAYPCFLCYTEELCVLIQQIYKKYEHLLSIINKIPKIALQQFEHSCILEEVQSTNEIEGVHSTRKELSEVLDGMVSSSHFKSVVQKYRNILLRKELSFKSNEDIRAFYDTFAYDEVVLENPANKLDGKLFRKESVDIKSGGNKTIHMGSYPENRLLSELATALRILNEDSIPFLVRVSIFHYLFGYIHPFYDGNGRTDRFISSYYLAKHFHVVVALQLSIIIKKQRKKYYDLFKTTDSELNKADLTPFVYGFISIIAETLDDVINKLNRKSIQLKEYSDKLLEMNLSTDDLTNQIYFLLLQTALFYDLGLSIDNLMKATKKARNTIQKRLNKIPNENIISMKRKNQNFYKLNLNIFK